MSDATSLLFDLPGFRVVSCEEVDTGGRRAVIMQTADEHACPRCGVLTLLLDVSAGRADTPDRRIELAGDLLRGEHAVIMNGCGQVAAGGSTSDRPSGGLIAAGCDRRPPAACGTGCAGQHGDDVTNTAPAPATASDQPPDHEDHELGLEY